jgi:hypothetical protein
VAVTNPDIPSNRKAIHNSDGFFMTFDGSNSVKQVSNLKCDFKLMQLHAPTANAQRRARNSK